MPAILIRQVPERVHDWLKRTAAENRRSMTQQALYCFDWCMEHMGSRPDFPPPVRPAGRALRLAEIDAAKKEGRP